MLLWWRDDEIRVKEGMVVWENWIRSARSEMWWYAEKKYEEGRRVCYSFWGMLGYGLGLGG